MDVKLVLNFFAFFNVLCPTLIAFYLVHNSLLMIYRSPRKIKTIYKNKSMKTPTKCEIVPIKSTKSWRPIKRRSSKKCPRPPNVVFFPPLTIHSFPSFASSVLLFSRCLFESAAVRASSVRVSGRGPWLKSCCGWAGWRNRLFHSLHSFSAATLSWWHSVRWCSTVFRLGFSSSKAKQGLNHPQACCTWLISSPKRSNSPSTQAPFSRHFCTVSSWPSSPVCTRRDAIWRAHEQRGPCNSM